MKDPNRRFPFQYLEVGDGDDVLLKDDVYAVFSWMCQSQDERVVNLEVFKQQITEQRIIDGEARQTRAVTAGDGVDRAWRYVRVGDETQQFKPDGIAHRYSDDQAEPSAGDDPASDARPHMNVPRA